MENYSYEAAAKKSAKLLADNEPEAAAEVLSKFVERDDSFGAAYFSLANIQVSLDDTSQDALENYRRACVLEPDAPQFRLEYASSLQSNGRYAEAVEQCEIALQISPDSIDALRRRGLAHYYAGNLDASQTDFAHVLKLDPTNGFAYLRRSINFSERSQLEDSLSELLRYDSLDSAAASEIAWLDVLRSNAFIELAGRCIETGNLTIVSKVLDQFLSGYVTSDDFLTSFFILCGHTGLDSAMIFFRESVAKDIEFDGDHGFGMSTKPAGENRTEDAIYILERSLALHPDHLKCLLQLGWCYFVVGDDVASERKFREAIELDGNSSAPLLRLAWVLASRDDPRSISEANDMAERMMNLPGSPEFKKLKVLARCQIAAGQISLAKTNIEKVREIEPDEDLSELERLLE